MISAPRRRIRGELLPAAATAVIALVTVSPWILGFAASHAAVAEHIAFAMGVAPVALLISALPAAAVSAAVAGAWLMASPWALGYASANIGAWSVDLVGGAILVALGAVAWRARGPWRAQDASARLNGGRP